VCIAAPVFGVDGEVAGAMSCTFPSYVFDNRGMEAEIRTVTEHARAASGSRPD
jgi:DNA-binding IclR family transcriptional regulator